MSHEYYNIVIGGEGVRRRSNGINAEKITFFNNIVRVSKGLLSTIVRHHDNSHRPLYHGHMISDECVSADIMISQTVPRLLRLTNFSCQQSVFHVWSTLTSKTSEVLGFG